MEDDSDTEMADYGTGFSDDVDRNFDALRTCACTWLDPNTKKPCGHSFCLKPKALSKDGLSAQIR
jgi:hypothetical protein